MARTRLQEALIHVPALVVAAGLAACSDSALHAPEPPGDAARGRLLLHQYHCDACHRISGVAGLDGVIGPPLDRVGSRVYLAGMLPNTPEDLARWLKSPQAIVPGNAMPDVGLSDQEARDAAAFLQTLR